MFGEFSYNDFGGTSADKIKFAVGKAGTGTTCKYWRLFYLEKNYGTGL
jgi:hypothetical protein